MSNDVLIVRPGDDTPELSVIGVTITVLSTSETANGQEITHQRGDKGMGPPPHSHAWDETFYVIRGGVEFTCQGRSTICREGTLVHIPAGTIHAFSIMEGGAEMLEITHRGQAVQAFTAIDEQLPKGPPDFGQAVRVFGENGVVIETGE